jgi:hypothetical protein
VFNGLWGQINLCKVLVVGGWWLVVVMVVMMMAIIICNLPPTPNRFRLDPLFRARRRVQGGIPHAASTLQGAT